MRLKYGSFEPTSEHEILCFKLYQFKEFMKRKITDEFRTFAWMHRDIFTLEYADVLRTRSLEGKKNQYEVGIARSRANYLYTLIRVCQLNKDLFKKILTYLKKS